MSLLYDIIFIIFGIFCLPYFLVKGKIHKGFSMRLGVLPRQIVKSLGSGGSIWLHAVSVGEINASRAILDSLREEFPSYKLVISTITKTGNQMAERIAKSSDTVIYFPFDLSLVVNRLIEKVKPKIFLTVETEIWPNFITNIYNRKIPIALINGRISLRSFKGYRIARSLFKTLLQKIDLFCMQTHQDSSRIISLGAPRDRVKVTGNMKFDISQSAEIHLSKMDELRNSLGLGIDIDNELFVAGSTHRGEERIILRAYQELSLQFPNLRLLVAPRHIERITEVQRLVTKYGFESFRVSQIQKSYCTVTPVGPFERAKRTKRANEQTVLLLDTMGQLRSIYSIATIVFVGGSLVPRGGHNLIEPASLSKPVLFGPYFFNFQEIAELLLKGEAAIKVSDEDGLIDACRNLLDHPEERDKIGRRARKMVEENVGATKRNMELIRMLLE